MDIDAMWKPHDDLQLEIWMCLDNVRVSYEVHNYCFLNVSSSNVEH